jgi:phage terminase large subunit
MFNTTCIYGQQLQAFFADEFKIYVHEGGSRSSKSTSIIQFLLTWAEKQDSTKRVIIARKKNTWTRSTVLYDFIKFMKEVGIYTEENHNKAEGIIKYGNVEFWFGGLDDSQRLHGFTSDGFWINEANEATKEDFDQLEIRCSGFGILDYNPNIDDDHWIPASVIKRPDCKYIHSTMLHNPFIPEVVRKKILSFEPTDENYSRGTADKRKWIVYGLGLRAKIEGLIFDKWEICQSIPSSGVKRYGGIDFGYSNDVTAIGEVGISDSEIFIDEVCYRTHMLTSEIISVLKNNLPGRKIWADSADPRLIAEIFNAGISISAVKKGSGSISAGIDAIKSKKIFITERSINAINEFKNYTYKQDKTGKWLNEPIDDQNHICDAVRYVALMEILGRNRKKIDLKYIFY